MATLTKADSKHMYSWWWDSHISPKNSKWLQENLADTDAKVKQMIKLVEVDEDSFARRAEMYYKKRPELMKLIEEFYRAYRALAERYDHATGVIKQAHQTMTEVFPNQVPFDESDDGSFSFANGSHPRSPEALVSLRAFHDLDEISYAEKDGALGSIKPQRCSILLEGRARKCLKFHDADAKAVQIMKNDECTETDQAHSDFERLGRSETDIQALKEALASLETEKQAGVLECEESLRRLSKLESEVMRAQEDSSGLHVRASNAEAEVQSLKESLSQLEGEREANLQKYQQCLDRISSLESNVSLAREETQRLDRQACKAEKDALILTKELVKINAEKEAYLAKYMEALEKIANLENRLLLAEDKASMTSDRACNAEKEVEALKEAFDRAIEEKEAASLLHQICLDKILTLEHEIALSHEETKRLKDEIDQGSAKLKVAEEQCLVLETSKKSMQDELDSFLNKLGVQNQELSEKKKELGDLWTCVQDERSRFLEAETALRTLQGLHSQTEDELRSASAELQRRVQLMKDMEIHGQGLQAEVQRIRSENKSLSEVNSSSSVSIKSMQDENSKLRESCQKSEAEMSALSEKLAVMEKLTEKRAVLEHCLSELGAELEDTREKVKALEEAYQLLMKEKSAVTDEKGTLNYQLEIMTENLENLTERNTCLDNSLFQANEELEALRIQSKNLEVYCRMLNEDKSVLLSERHALEIKLETAQGRLETLEKIKGELEHKYVAAEEQLGSALKLAENLRSSLSTEKQESVIAAKLSSMQMEGMEKKIHNLQEVGEVTRGQLEEEQNKAVKSQFEIFILKNIMHDLQATNSSLLSKCGKLLESSKLSEKLLLELEYENIEQQEEENFLSEHIKILRMGMFQLLKVLDVDLEIAYEGNLLDDQAVLHHLLIKLDDMRNNLCKAWEENQKLNAEKSVLETLHEHLKEEVADLKVLINTLQLEFRNGNNQLSSLHKDMPKLLQSHEELILKVTEGNHKEDLLAGEVNNLRAKILKMQSIYQNVEKENCRILGEKKSLMKVVLKLDEEKRKLEDDNSCLVEEALTLDTLSFVFKIIVSEKSEEINHLACNMKKLCDENSVLEDKMRNMECMLDKYELENLNLNDSLEKYDEELEESRITNHQLQLDLLRERDEFSQKEMELLEAVMVEDGQAKQIIKLSESYAQQLKENERLRVSKQDTDAELHRILKKQIQTEDMMEKGKAEAELWETVAGSFFIELQTSSVREALFREKLAELTKEYEHVDNENSSKGLELVQMKGRLESLEGENYQVRAQLAQLIPSLKDSLASLESHAIHTDCEDDFFKDTASSQKTSTDEEVVGAVSSDRFPELQDIAVRMKAVEKKVMEMKKLSQERSLRALKSRSSRSRRGSNRSGRRISPPEPTEKQPVKETAHYQSTKPHHKNASYPCEAGELMMKDIMLDQPSETRWSLAKNRRGLYANSESDEQILELWETIDQSQSIDLTVEVDKQEIPKRSVDNNDNSKKVLESLAYDVQRLANLQITVQDLKHKVANTESSNPAKGKGAEYGRVKEQLDETDKAITKLLDINGKLMKKLDNYSPASSVGNTPSSIADSPELGESKRRTNVFQQARRCSQKVGRLQLEVQKMQFLLLNLDGGSTKMGRATGNRVSERNSKILLKDYLYVGARIPRRKKKTHFCGCVQPRTSGD